MKKLVYAFIGKKIYDWYRRRQERKHVAPRHGADQNPPRH